MDAPGEAKDLTFDLSLITTPVHRSTLLKAHARLKYLLQIKRLLVGVNQLRKILANSELSTIFRNLYQVCCKSVIKLLILVCNFKNNI